MGAPDACPACELQRAAARGRGAAPHLAGARWDWAHRAVLFRAVPGAFDPADIRIGQALADVATISLLHERSMRHSDTVNEQLQTALNSRVIIEQAKGKLAERLGLDMDQAFSVLRDHARTRNLLLSDVALAFIDGSGTLARTGAAQEHPARRDRLPPG